MKYYLLASFFVLQITSMFAQGDRLLIDKVVARIGSEIIMLSEVEEQFAYAKSQNQDLPKDFRCIALQSMLVNKMLVNQAKIDSVLVDDAEVENQLDARVERLLTYFNQDESAIEEYYGQTIPQMKETMRTDMTNQLTSEKMQNQILADVTITPAEVKRFFKEIPADSLPYFNSEVEIRELVYKPKVNDVQKIIASDKIRDIRRVIVEEGKDFAEMAKRFSADPGSGRQGGDLGWQKRGTFVPEFEAAAYNLEINQISEVIETEFGYHIIQLQGRRGNLIQCRHILIKPTITDEDFNLAEEKMDSIRNMITVGTITFSQAVKLYGDKNYQSYNNDGRVTNQRSGNSFFELADLDYEVYEAIEPLEPGQVGTPIITTAPDGEKYYRLIELGSRSKPHRADLKRDYNRIQKAALEQKKAGYMEVWLMDKLKDVYLNVDSMFSDCENIKSITNY